MEQHGELQRQANLKQLAAAADQRWNEKKSYLDKPGDTGQAPAEIFEPRDRGGYGGVGPHPEEDGKPLSEQGDSSGMKSVAGSQEEVLGAARGEDVVQGRFKGPAGPTDARERDTDSAGDVNRRVEREVKPKKEDPWKKARGTPGEEWQPQAWAPPGASRR